MGSACLPKSHATHQDLVQISKVTTTHQNLVRGSGALEGLLSFEIALVHRGTSQDLVGRCLWGKHKTPATAY